MKKHTNPEDNVHIDSCLWDFHSRPYLFSLHLFLSFIKKYGTYDQLVHAQEKRNTETLSTLPLSRFILPDNYQMYIMFSRQGREHMSFSICIGKKLFAPRWAEASLNIAYTANKNTVGQFSFLNEENKDLQPIFYKIKQIITTEYCNHFRT
jgi:hypothetical protein